MVIHRNRKSRETKPAIQAPRRVPASTPDVAVLWKTAQADASLGRATLLTPHQLNALSPSFSAEEIDHLVIPKRTLARRRARREALTREETDNALRLARILTEATRVFGHAEKAAHWLRRPNGALAGQPPLALLASETGGCLVDELLGQIDHGLFI